MKKRRTAVESSEGGQNKQGGVKQDEEERGVTDVYAERSCVSSILL